MLEFVSSLRASLFSQSQLIKQTQTIKFDKEKK